MDSDEQKTNLGPGGSQTLAGGGGSSVGRDRTSLPQRFMIEHDLASDIHGRQKPSLLAWLLPADFSQARLQAALDEIWARQEALRSYFPDPDDPFAVGLLPAEDGWPIEVREVSAAGLERDLHSLWTEPFDFATGPLVRCYLLNQPEGPTVLAIVPEHLVFDGDSVAVLCGELSSTYAGEEPPPLEVTYYELAGAEREMLASSLAEEGRRFWTEHWGDRPGFPATHLPARAGGISVHQGGAVWKVYDTKLTTEDVRGRALELQATPFLLGATAVAEAEQLAAPGEPVGFMFPTNNRMAPGSESVIGFFANPVNVYLDVDPELPPEANVESVRSTILGALEFQELVTQHVIETMRPDEDHLGHDTPYVFFALNDGEQAPVLSLDGEPCAPIGNQLVESKRWYPGVDVILSLTGDNAELMVQYATAAYDSDVIDRFGEAVCAALRRLVTPRR